MPLTYLFLTVWPTITLIIAKPLAISTHIKRSDIVGRCEIYRFKVGNGTITIRKSSRQKYLSIFQKNCCGFMAFWSPTGSDWLGFLGCCGIKPVVPSRFPQKDPILAFFDGVPDPLFIYTTNYFVYPISSLRMHSSIGIFWCSSGDVAFFGGSHKPRHCHENWKPQPVAGPCLA